MAVERESREVPAVSESLVRTKSHLVWIRNELAKHEPHPYLNMNITRRGFILQGSALTLAVGCASRSTQLQRSPVIPLVEGPEVARYRRAQERVLAKYAVEARSRSVRLRTPALQAHVLVAGRGEPLVLIHGGGAEAAQFAPLLGGLQGNVHCFAPDRPGCGLSDKIDYVGVPFRQHIVDFMTSLLDELRLPKAALAGNSMGGYWSLVFALAAPERVTKVVLLGGVAGSSAPPSRRLPNSPQPSLENAKGLYQALMADGARASGEMVEMEYASKCLPGASLGWDSMLEQLWREGVGTAGLTYALRPELKNLKPRTLFLWGDKDIEGPPSLAQEMAALAPRATCEIVTDAGHLVWLDQPELCTRRMIDFLKQA